MSNIPYLDEVWNPVTGCTACSPACERCWAAAMAARFAQTHAVAHGEDGPLPIPFSRIALHPDRLYQPLHWRKARVIGVCMMGDWLHPRVPDSYRDRMVRVMAQTRQHIYLALTKRVTNMRRYMGVLPISMPENLWLGVSAWDQESWDRNVGLLRDTSAAHRWVSLEPLLGPVDIGKRPGIEQLVIGCESGSGRRPMHLDWLQPIRNRWRGHTGSDTARLYLKQHTSNWDGTGKLICRDPQPSELAWELTWLGKQT